MFSLLCAQSLGACSPPPEIRPVAPATSQEASASQPKFGSDPLDLAQTPERGAEVLVQRYTDRILAWKHAPEYVSRVESEDRPIIESAVNGAPSLFRQIAESENCPLAEMKTRWVALQEADILLESSGDPDAMSGSHAAGVAQWMAATGQGAGLRLDPARSTALTARIEPLEVETAWLRYLASPGADLSVRGAPSILPDAAARLLPERELLLSRLRAERRRCDDRFVPERALRAQTLYLARLYRLFPSMDWLYQAYHGGEGGVGRLLRLYRSGAWSGTAAAIGSGARRLTFERVYATVRPGAHGKAFSYLFSRSDDHRHYWWKLRACEHVIARFRRDKEQFKKSWLDHLPGRPQEALWYPDAPRYAVQTADALASVLRTGTVLPVTSVKGMSAAQTPYGPRQDSFHAAARPETLGLLKLVSDIYRKNGAVSGLTAGDLMLSSEDLRTRAAAMPLPVRQFPPDIDAQHPPGGGPPIGFDYHTTGLAADIIRPPDQTSARVLDYTLDYLAERDLLTRTDRKDHGFARTHLVPNPRFGRWLRNYLNTSLPTDQSNSG